MVDFDTQRGGHGNKNIRLSPWFQYHYAHRITLDGLVIEYSYAYRYYLGWRRAFFFPERGMDRLGNPFENTLENGFLPSSETMDFGPLKKWLASLEDLPEEQAKNQLEQSPMGRIAQVALEPPEVAQFEELLVSDIPIVAVELPFSPYAYILSEQKHDEFLAMMSRLTDMHGDLFIPSYGIVSIPENGWLDLRHMNQFGAKVFSQWLADQLVEKGLSAQLLEAHE
ncbi:MAG: hypothetical protein D6770_07675 [Anaerolineae bacterium]|nr:MAG: hypothetical protein D6770_07675 [Anaerolineae bacterium]